MFTKAQDEEDKNWDTPGLTFDKDTYCYQTNGLNSGDAKQVSVYTNLVGDDAIKISVRNGNYYWDDLYLEAKISYFYEATFRNSTNGGICQPCRYHLQATEDECDSGSIRYCYNPFIAYCFDGQSPRRLSCVQDPFFHEPSFYGDFFFPPQIPWEQQYVPIHDILTGSYPKPTDDYFVPNTDLESDPTNYGLSKRNLKRHLYQMYYEGDDPFDDSKQSSTIKSLRSMFLNVSAWTTWGQKRCMYFCHRDSVMILKYVTSDDITKTENKAWLNILHSINRKDWICKRCLSETDAVFNQDNSILFQMATDDGCIPWFGSVPVLQNSSTFPGLLEMIKVETPLTTKIRLATGDNEVYEYPYPHSESLEDDITKYHTLKGYQSSPCPVNFYNRICAYTIESSVNNLSGIEKYNMMNYCSRCPDGWHTNGKNSSWFCIPPNGYIFFNNRMLRKFWSKDTSSYNHSKAWARRDLIKYELECGPLPSQCQQCKGLAGAGDLTPAQFNEKYIFEPLLRVDACPSGYYCPDPLHSEKIQCPLDKACSPVGSHSIVNCTCCAGQFLNVSSNQCENCYSYDMCRSGTFMQGVTQCKTSIGPKQVFGGGVCSNCTNLPLNSHFVEGKEYGIEVVTDISTGLIRNICPFRCNQGYKISWTTNEGFKSQCYRTYTCEPIISSSTNLLGPFDFQSVGRLGFYYNSELANMYDGISITKNSLQGFECTIKQDLKINYDNVKNGLANKEANVHSTCTAANPVECGGINKLCMVTQEATYYQNYNCSPCSSDSIIKPVNAFYLDETLNGSTQLSMRNKLCSWKCNEGFYRNGSDCKSCSDLAMEKCPNANYSIQGMGCRGVEGEFNTINWTLNCVTCSKSVGMVTSGSYLDEMSCEILRCPEVPVLQVGYYFSVRCGGNFKNYVQKKCADGCPLNQYQSNACTNISDRICRNCTLSLPGYYKIVGSVCTLHSDIQWSLCNPNNYCDGSGVQSICPNGKLSKAGSSSVIDCYCPLGTELNSIDGVNCIEKDCGDHEETIMNSPSTDGNKISRYYYSMDETEMKTMCVPCNEDQIKVAVWDKNSHSFASSSRIGVQSCRCPINKYAVVSAGQRPNVTCNDCNARGSSDCTRDGYYGFLNNGVVCASGLESGPKQCFCVLPPYTLKNSQTCSFSRCIQEYESVSTTSGRPNYLEVNVTGSNAYIITQNQLSWKLGIGNNVQIIKQIVATSNYQLSSIDSVQYLLFTSNETGHRNQIHVQNVNNNNYDGNRFKTELWNTNGANSPYINGYSKWIVFDINGGINMDKSIVVFTISRWPWAVPKEQFDATVSGQLYKYWTWVGALVYDVGLKVYSLYVSRMYPASDGGYSYSFDYSVSIYNVANSTVDGSSKIVSMSHAYSYPGMIPWLPSASASSEDSRYGAFYIAYNYPNGVHCGIHATFISHNNMTLSNKNLQLNLSNSTRKRQIQTTTVVENSDNVPGVLIYVLYSDFFSGISEGILLVEWRESSQSVNSDTALFSQNNVEYILPKMDQLGRKIISYRNLIRLWGRSTSLKNFMVLGEVVESTQKNSSVIFTSDSVVRTFTEVQGMPIYSEPSHITGFERSENEVVMFGSGKGSVHYLESLRRCISPNSIPVYWDGISTCVTHQCSRTRSCSHAQNKKMVNGECICLAGYEKKENGDCILCPANSYCIGGVKYLCGQFSGLMSEAGSYSFDQCKCSTQNYFDTSSNKCSVCPNGYYCPNRWNKIGCPGKSKISSSGYMFPTRCSCMPGAEGPACRDCPDGSKCFESTSTTADKTNVGVMISVRLKQEANSLYLSLIKDVGCTVLLKEVKAHLGNPIGGLNYFANDVTLQRRFYCDFVFSDSELRGPHLFVLVVQADASDNVDALVSNIASLYNTISNINNVTTSILFQYAEILSIVYSNTGGPDMFNFKSIQVQECPATQAPDADRKECVCKPGYFFQTTRCEPCPVGFFKSSAGQERCMTCPAGTTTKTIGGVNCINPFGDKNSGNFTMGNDNGSSSIGFIVGGVVGGIALILLIIFLYYMFGMNQK